MANNNNQATGTFNISSIVVGGAALIIVTLLGVVWNNLSGDISELKSDQKKTVAAISDSKLEVVKSISGVEKQIVQTNQKLDDFIAEMRKRR